MDTVTNNVYHIHAAVSPLEANQKKVSWTTDNPIVTIVDQTGNVTALSEGIATITVTTVDFKLVGGLAVSK
ncbi:Ig-like domain-containing protein [Paenibacillus sp. HWE-109]|uniref:Ig-like domain-containing protein n=1 Tax=Paenibacillus sp. HWE-109 TaxID=1306526 RepID=UPI001EDE8CEC|nr:Ig-like domain-containing protein [Paenibacillus sp. HWE-109]UKS28258.1 Ig-like domain-containing protein [Paenibacillus sp. HWE-109]